MKNVTDRVSNPFGLRPPCSDVVPGYGDVNADFHVVGDNPSVHGGRESKVPFSSGEGLGVQEVLEEVGLLEDIGVEPVPHNVFMSYLYMCVGEPGEDDYRRLERYFDAELRAINAHVLVPVGERACRHMLREYTAQWHKLRELCAREQGCSGALHTKEVRGGGFLVLPFMDPGEWDEGDREEAVAALRGVLESDYRQTKGVATRFG